MNLKEFNPLTQRLIVSVITIAIVACAIYFSYSPWLSILAPLVTAFIAGSAIKEYYQIAQIKGLNPSRNAGVFLCILYIFCIYLFRHNEYQFLLPFLFLSISLFAVFCSYLIRGR